ncbi:MAG: hypothetical protein DELT_00071 [Desulfovibrio sp.]
MRERFASLRNALNATAIGNTVAVAYSGGLDSRFLVHAALLAGFSLRVFHVRGPHVPAHEKHYALNWAQRNGVALTVLDFDPLETPALRQNPKDRCYHCKRAVFAAILHAARTELGESAILCDGTNISDAGEYRPGRKALQELAVRSPLAEAGFTKDDIRILAAQSGMENPGQAAQPCLLTRFGYGAVLSAALLSRVDAGEEAVRRVLTARGKPNTPFRLRYENAVTPALHVAFEPEEALAAELATALGDAGFAGAPVRVVKFLSGYFDS